MSFCNEMKSLSSGGTTRRVACGSTTYRIACPCESPSASALATCEGWIESMPERKTSATYAPYDSTSAPRPSQNVSLVTPWSWRAGMPKPARITTSRVGTPRNRSV